MTHRVELGAALLATVLGLIWVTSVARVVEGSTMTGILNVGGGSLPSVSNMVNYCVAMALILVALSLGAYLHTQLGLLVGVALLWVSGVLLIASLILYLFAPLYFMPATLAVLLSQPDSGWTPVVAVLMAVLSGIAAVAAVTPPLARLSSAAR